MVGTPRRPGAPLSTYSLPGGVPAERVYRESSPPPQTSGLARRPAPPAPASPAAATSGAVARPPSAPESTSAMSKRLVADLQRARPGQEAEFVGPLRALGIAGLDALAAAFPGPLRADPFRLEAPPRGRDVSAVAYVLHALSEWAFSHLKALLGHASAEVRLPALLLAIDADHPHLHDAITSRLFDEDYAVARTAERHLAALRAPARREVLGAQLSAFVRSRAIERPRRLRAIELLVALRLDRGLGALADALDDADPTIAASAHGALRLLTAHDHGVKARAWASLLRDVRTKGRPAVLLDALGGDVLDLRDLAAAELARLTRETLGYAPGAGREHAQRVRIAYAKLLGVKL